ncbi:MAG TPA: chemotaxis protein CheB, partial [Candidatus Berkiella sp.]|nr:chemotaxis protein CheB [Candidatus Berkiella sp.]
AETAGNNSVGIILSGMGSDGANGMLALKKAGATTIAQDEESSVVWGMPKVAIELDAIKYVMPLHKIPQKMLECLGAAS